MNKVPIISALSAYFDSTGYFRPISSLKGITSLFNHFKYVGWLERDIYIRQIFEWVEINNELAEEDRQTTEEVIMEFFNLQAWTDPHLQLDRSGKLDEINPDGLSESDRKKLQGYMEMAKQVAAIFKNHGW
ncbi:hypothetical protein [Pareuzebyella sediminis]|uniref:hypothetical protein n=1 Tax=Pareuzebyella sediminis TaxID=2607998 RepID=UPI0011EBDE95|nr:hypothetical protein [Pareuzebyella sediminis]